MSTSELLDAWRDASRAAELAARLAREAEELADEADETAHVSEEIAALAAQVAAAATVVAERARMVSQRATAIAASRRAPSVGDARHVEDDALAAETEARDRYHVAEADARARLGLDREERVSRESE